ncbi:MAG TPA: DUF6600 domain-containing protein [Verrucomicrobiales bacterium]|nr:DUF6600 domain-containing protein [Verrucomicrobiales bacterium]
MKTRLLSALAASASLVLTSCDKPELSAQAPAKDGQAETPAEPAAEPVAAEPSEAEKKLASQVQELEARELALQQQMEDERLAAADAEIAKEQELLQKEREAWALEQQLADAKAAAETPAREAPPVDTSSPVANAGDYQTFYDDLDPLGSWYESPDYGYVWQPSIAISDNSWRPYTKGRWASADQGWTWCSDEPFGWACYHYGRWAKVKGRGWVWIPGDQWAPAWVCWRKTDKYIGWCPLPPETVYDSDISYGSSVDEDCGIYPGGYVFMPVRYFDQPVYSYCEMPSVCLTIYNTSINITNLIIRRHRVECGGPQYDWISQCVRHPMPRYTLACESNRPDRRRSPLIDKDRLHCFAPKVYAPWNVALRPARTKANLAGAEVIRRSESLPDKLMSRFQQERRQRDREADNLKGVGQKIVEHQRKLATLEKTRESIELTRRDRTAGVSGPAGQIPDRSDSRIRPGRQTGGDTVRPNRQDSANLAEAKEQLEKLRAQRNSKLPDSKQPEIRNDRTPGPQGNPATADNKEQARLAETRADLEARKQQLAKLRADREASAKTRPQPPAVTADNNPKTRNTDPAARIREDNDSRTKEQIARQRTALEEQRRAADAANRDLEKQTADRAAAEDQRRRQQDAENKFAKEQLAKQRDDLEQQRRASDTAARDKSRQMAERAALENQRRETEEAQNKATKEQIARQRTALEDQRRAADAASREADKQKAERAALEDTRRRQQEAANEQAKAQIAAQRAALEQQRRQAEEQARADRQARDQAAAAQQREAMAQQQQREAMQRQAQEQAARQREAMENQRRQAEEQNRQENMRRQAEDRAREQQERRQAEEANRRQAEEQNRRQAEEANRRQAEESRRQSERAAKEAADRESKRGR